MHYTLGAANPQSYVFSFKDDFVGQLARDISGGSLSDAAAKLLDYYSIMNSKYLAAKSARQVYQSQLQNVLIGRYAALAPNGTNFTPAYSFDAGNWLVGQPVFAYDVMTGVGMAPVVLQTFGNGLMNGSPIVPYPYSTTSGTGLYRSPYTDDALLGMAERYDQLRASEEAFDVRRQAALQVQAAAVAGNTGMLATYAALPRTLADDFYTVTEDPLNPLTLAPIVVINPLSQKSETSIPLAPVQEIQVDALGAPVTDSAGNATLVTDGTGNPVLVQPFSAASGLSKIFLPAFEFVTKSDADGVAAKPGTSALPILAAAAAGLFLALK